MPKFAAVSLSNLFSIPELYSKVICLIVFFAPYYSTHDLKCKITQKTQLSPTKERIYDFCRIFQ